MNKKLSEPIEQIEELSEDAANNLIAAIVEYSKQSAIGFSSLHRSFISLMESILANGRNVYRLFQAETIVARNNYLNAKWYNKWYLKKTYFKTIKEERSWRDVCNDIERELVKAKQTFIEDISKPSTTLKYFTKTFTQE